MTSRRPKGGPMASRGETRESYIATPIEAP
jgi:hypothetical protein